ncbi:hypothetical protein CHS0354_014875 [Potamilus streckersoni]|uniref:Uncharacterized protein n=1 Tax=Potamilus streckersoni TaxID=2493646 RepID=A0AAE0WDB4_9BIVA|nr:hypothetical protein CHS0354_014875 [Potamilus streckersoni]
MMGGRCTKVNNPRYFPGNYTKTDGIQCYTLSDKVEFPPVTEFRCHSELSEDDTNTATTSTGYITVLGAQHIKQEEMTNSVEYFEHCRKRSLLDECDYLREELRLKEENMRRDYQCCDLELEVTMLRRRLCLLREKEILMQDLMNTADDFKRKFGKDVEQVDDNSELYKKLISIRLKMSLMDKINSHCDTLTHMESPREVGSWTRRNSRDPKRDSCASACKCSANAANLLQEIESIIAREIRNNIPQSYENRAYCQHTSDGSDCQRPRPHYRKPTSDYYSYT